jgi:hypothetical protein
MLLYLFSSSGIGFELRALFFALIAFQMGSHFCAYSHLEL